MVQTKFYVIEKGTELDRKEFFSRYFPKKYDEYFDEDGDLNEDVDDSFISDITHYQLYKKGYGGKYHKRYIKEISEKFDGIKFDFDFMALVPHDYSDDKIIVGKLIDVVKQRPLMSKNNIYYVPDDCDCCS